MSELLQLEAYSLSGLVGYSVYSLHSILTFFGCRTMAITVVQYFAQDTTADMRTWPTPLAESLSDFTIVL